MQRKEYYKNCTDAIKYAKRNRWLTKRIKGHRGFYNLIYYICLFLGQNGVEFNLCRTVIARLAKCSVATVQKSIEKLEKDKVIKKVYQGKWGSAKGNLFKLHSVL